MKKFYYLLLFIILLPLVAMIWISYEGFKERNGHSDVGVVLGTTVYPDGTMSPFLKGRVDAALELYHKGSIDLIFVSGGMGVEGHDEPTVMAQYLMSHSVPYQDIIIDSSGWNTKATAQNLKTFMQEHSLSSATVVTQFFHIPRTRLALQCVGIDTKYSAYSTEYGIRDFYSTLREVPAYMVYWWQC